MQIEIGWLSSFITKENCHKRKKNPTPKYAIVHKWAKKEERDKNQNNIKEAKT